MTAQTLEDILVTDKEVEGYMKSRDTGEHLKIKRPSEYLDDVEKYFSEDLTGGLELPFKKTAEDFKVRMGEITLVTGYSGMNIAPMIRYINNGWFITPAYETTGKIGVTMGYEIKLGGKE